MWNILLAIGGGDPRRRRWALIGIVALACGPLLGCLLPDYREPLLWASVFAWLSLTVAEASRDRDPFEL